MTFADLKALSPTPRTNRGIDPEELATRDCGPAFGAGRSCQVMGVGLRVASAATAARGMAGVTAMIKRCSASRLMLR